MLILEDVLIHIASIYQYNIITYLYDRHLRVDFLLRSKKFLRKQAGAEYSFGRLGEYYNALHLLTSNGLRSRVSGTRYLQLFLFSDGDRK